MASKRRKIYSPKPLYTRTSDISLLVHTDKEYIDMIIDFIDKKILTCPVCGKQVLRKRSTKIYCCDSCKVLASKRRKLAN